MPMDIGAVRRADAKREPRGKKGTVAALITCSRFVGLLAVRRGVSIMSECVGDRLKFFVDRIEHLTDERDALSEDIKDVFKEAQSAGFVPKIMRAVLKIRRMDQADRDEQEALLDTYLRALGMQPDLFEDAA